jgi:hypothetical protein
VRNPWLDLADHAPYVLAEDREQIERFNCRSRLSERRKLRLEVVPEPYIGSIEAPIFFLKLNPGYSQDDIAFTEDAEARRIWYRNLLHLSLEYPFYALDPTVAWASNARWWRHKLKHLIREFGEERVATNASCIEAFPYHSYGSPGFPGVLPSQRYSFHLVNAAIDRSAIILMANTVKWWKQEVPRLHSYSRLYIATNPQNGHITSGYYPEGYAAVQNVLRQL